MYDYITMSLCPDNHKGRNVNMIISSFIVNKLYIIKESNLVLESI